MTPPVSHKPTPSASVPQPRIIKFKVERKIIHIFKKEEAKKGLNQLFATLNGVAPYTEKPLVCMAGDDRPPLVAEYKGHGSCDYPQAQKLISLGQQQYHQSCQIPWDQAQSRIEQKVASGQKLDASDHAYLKRANRRISVDMFTMVKAHPFADRSVKFPIASQFRFQPTTCGEAQYSIPVILQNFQLSNPDKIHPFFKIAFHLNADQLHDFRSAQSFKKMAESMEPVLKKSGTRNLNVAYPASSSHLAPLVVAFHLIDRGRLNGAEFNLSEIDTHTPERIAAYLNLMAKMVVTLPGAAKPRKLITGLRKKVRQDTKDQWVQTTFSFYYRGKPITLKVFNNPEKDKYISDRYLKNSNLLVLHDLTENPVEEERLLTTMAKFHDQGKGISPAWVVATDKPKSLSQKATVQKFSGRYGCGPVDHTGKLFGNQTWTVTRKGPDQHLISSVRHFLDPFDKHSDISNIKIHHDQRVLPFYLIAWE